MRTSPELQPELLGTGAPSRSSAGKKMSGTAVANVATTWVEIFPKIKQNRGKQNLCDERQIPVDTEHLNPAMQKLFQLLFGYLKLHMS